MAKTHYGNFNIKGSLKTKSLYFDTSSSKVGTVNLSSGYAFVNDDTIGDSAFVILTPQPSGTLNGNIRVSTITPSSGFSIQSTNIADNATIAWLIVERE